MSDPSPERQEFTFERISDTEKRKARALEYIAHYLGRIEKHLAAVAQQSKPSPQPGSLEGVPDASASSADEDRQPPPGEE